MSCRGDAEHDDRGQGKRSHNTGYEAFLLTFPTNYYAITALLFVFAVAVFGLDFGPMRRHETRAIQEGALWDESRGGAPGEADRSLRQRSDGRVATSSSRSWC